MVDDRERSPLGRSLNAWLQEPGLTEGQRRRLRLFETVEGVVGVRVERLCGQSGLEVTDAAVLVVAPAARSLFFSAPGISAGDAMPGGASIVLGHRHQLYEYLQRSLPPADDAPFDPYMDLLQPSPPQCVRVLIVDDESLTVLNYGAFVTLRLDLASMPQA